MFLGRLHWPSYQLPDYRTHRQPGHGTSDQFLRFVEVEIAVLGDAQRQRSLTSCPGPLQAPVLLSLIERTPFRVHHQLNCCDVGHVISLSELGPFGVRFFVPWRRLSRQFGGLLSPRPGGLSSRSIVESPTAGAISPPLDVCSAHRIQKPILGRCSRFSAHAQS